MPGEWTTETRFLLTDHLGSVDAVTDHSGAVVERVSFDAWGQRRQQVDWKPFTGSTLANSAEFDNRWWTMGVEYFVAVHARNWPTAQALQSCIDSHGWPVKVGDRDHPRWQMAFEETPDTLGLSVVFRGNPVELEVSIVTLSPDQPYSFSLDRIECSPPAGQLLGENVYRADAMAFEMNDINEALAGIGEKARRFEYGDRVLAFTFRMSKIERCAAFYIMAGFIECFDGFGFSPDGTNGSSKYAKALVKEAIRLERDLG